MQPARFLTLILTLTLTLPLLSAFTVSIEPVKQAILPGEQALFRLHITNTADENATYRIIFLDPDWFLTTRPSTDYFNGITLAPGESRSTLLILQPRTKLVPYVYLLEVMIAREGANESQRFFIPVEIQSEHRSLGEFLIAVSRLVDIPKLVDPREPLTITVHLKNRNPRVIEDFTIHATSPLFTKTLHTRLEGLEEKNVTLTIPLPPTTPPGEYPVNITLIADGEFLEPVIRDTIHVIPYTSVNVTQSAHWGFFTRITSFTIKNMGNAPANVSLSTRLPTSLLIHLTRFHTNTSTLPRELIVNASGAYAVTRITLPPGGEATVEARTSYTLFFWLFIILTGSWILYSVMRSPVQIRKDAIVVGVSQGGVSEIRIVLHVKNLSGKKRFKDITIIDPLPRLVEFIKEKDERFGKPRVYVNEREGSVIKWHIDSLEPYEERIITYRVRSRLSLLGKITLPRALLTFKDEDGTEQVTRSNPVRLDF